jgi:hypothetical protein
MKKQLLVVIALSALVGFKPEVKSQTGFNAVLEYCTGTWCLWCPCGHDIINSILEAYPNTMVLAYHGAGSDQWLTYSLPMIQLFGFSAYPTGVVSRRTGIISRSAWNNPVVIQNFNTNPGCSIQLNNKSYNAGTRTITGDIVMTALEPLTGSYYVNIILTEDNLIYPQTGNSSCTGGSNYVHMHVVKGLVNGATGTLLNTNDDWGQGNSVTVPLNYVIPATVVEGNAHLNIFVYKGGGNVSTDQHIQQSKVETITNVTGISGQSGNVPELYSLGQNYPNPFNPTTNFKFSIPKDENVTLKFFDAMGREVSTYIDNGFLKAGTYNVDFDGASLSSGIYFYTLKTSSFVETKKMMLVK